MSNLKKSKNITLYLKKLLEQLPNKEEKEDLIKGINEVIKFLNNVNKSLEILPTLEEANKAKEALEKLNNIIERNPLVREVFSGKSTKGLNIHKAEKETQVKLKPEGIKEEINKLLKMPENTLRSYLQQEKRYPKKVLMLILSQLGRRISKETLRRELVEEIVTAIVNARTYDGLRSDNE